MTYQKATFGNSAIYAPVDPQWMYRGERAHKAGSLHDMVAEYEWDDSYNFFKKRDIKGK